ncbi:MAG: efflux transporter outer membrane subunit [Myxococcaceae bacterium]|nr:efflux transporter outer membrane subunit [Myxococcaceae bacterium]
MSRAACAGVVLWALTGCAVGPNYRRPDIVTPSAFRFAAPPPAGTPADTASLADLPWWALYRDPALQRLIATALAQNLDLRAAAARVQGARALAVGNDWALWPQLSVAASADRSKNQTAVPFPQARRPFNAFSLSAVLNWEIDLWGRLRRLSEAGWASFMAAEENRRALVASLVAEVAQTWFELKGLDLQRQIAARTIETRRRTLELYRSRLQAGVGNATEVANGEALLAQAQAEEASVLLQIGQVEDRLSLLLGQPPGAIARPEEDGLAFETPDVPPGLPAELLERRPDVRAAEQLLIAANAQVGVAEASFFPRISLTGALGYLSAELSQLLGADASSWRYGGSVLWPAPVLSGEQLVAAREEAVANFEAAKSTYAQTVLTALQEVSDALWAAQQLRTEIGALKKQVAALGTQRRLAEARFKAGVASYLEVTTIENSLFPAELALAQARTRRAQALVQLYRALGGGWQTPQVAGTGAGTKGQTSGTANSSSTTASAVSGPPTRR